MPDITMCVNKECPLFSACYRAQAVPNEFRQSFSSFKPEGRECDHYWPIDKYEERTE